MRHLFSRKSGIILAVVAVVGLVACAVYQTAYGFSQRLPGGIDVSANGDGEAIELHLKNLNVAQVTSNQMNVYYPLSEPRAGGKSITINSGAMGRICNIDAAVTGSIYVRIRIDGATTPNSGQYNIPIQEVCTGDQFYSHEFPFPNGRLIRDQFSDLYKAEITIQYNTNRLNGDIGNDINYKMRVSGDAANTGRLALRLNADATQFGMRSSYTNNPSAAPAGRDNVRLEIPFGYHCSADINSAANRTVRIYDSDNVFGDAYMWVEKDGVRLPRDAYENGQNLQDFLPSGEGPRWKLRDSNNGENSVEISPRYIERGARYVLGFANIAENIDNRPAPYNTVNPHQNTLSVGIPQDSIYAEGNCNYRLRPSVTLGSSSYTYTPNIDVTSTMVKTGPSPVPEQHDWELYAVRYSSEPSNRNLTDNFESGGACGKIPAGGSGCRRVNFGTYDNQTQLRTPSYSEGGPDAAGTRLCFFARVQNPTQSPDDDTLWSYSDLACAVSVVRPKLQAWGYDTRATGIIQTSLSDVDGRRYGSWGEYSLLSNGSNRGMASGAGLNGGAASGAGQAEWSPLTFANSAASAFSCAGGFGCFGGIVQPTVAVQGAVTAPSAGDYTVNSYADLERIIGNKGRLRVDGTLFINGNIIYPDSFTGIGGLAKMQLIARDIVVGENVGRIDPWLIAYRPDSGQYGNISTCSAVRSGTNYFVRMQNVNLSSQICDQPLKFNSPLIADKVYLYRTFDEPSGTTAAETLNVRADNFLSSYAGGGTNQPVATTSSITELPPRF